jgi:hypothetical protein
LESGISSAAISPFTASPQKPIELTVRKIKNCKNDDPSSSRHTEEEDRDDGQKNRKTDARKNKLGRRLLKIYAIDRENLGL